MEYTNADVFAYQILDCLVTQYQYQIVNVPGNKKDIWIACEKNETFPMIRLNVSQSTSAFFEKEYLQKIKMALSSVLRNDKPLLIINTNDASQGFVEGDLIQVVLTQRKIANHEILQTFPELVHVLHDVEDKQKECARLTRHLETVQMRKLKERRKFDVKKMPFASVGIIAIATIIMLLSATFIHANWDDLMSGIIMSGAYYKSLVLYGGEYWRLLTAGFVHLSIIELLFYSLFLYQLGQLLEKPMGRIPFIIIFVLSTIVGNACMFIIEGNNASWGMGPGITGLVCTFILYIWDAKLYKNRFIMSKATYLVIMVFLIATLSGSSLYALLGAGIGGLFMGMIFLKSKAIKPFKIHFIICGILMVGVLGYLVSQVNSAYPQYKEVDKKIVEGYKKIGLEGYSKHVQSIFKKVYEE